jgi:hypothetical protein
MSVATVIRAMWMHHQDRGEKEGIPYMGHITNRCTKKTVMVKSKHFLAFSTMQALAITQNIMFNTLANTVQ